MKHFLIYIFFLFSFFTVFSQDDKEQLPIDNSFVEQKNFDSERIENYKGLEEFTYVYKKDTSFLQRVLNWLKRVVKYILSLFTGDIGPAIGFLWGFLRALPYIIAIIIVFILLKFFLKVNVNSIISTKKNQSIINLSTEEELIKERDLSALIKEAIKNQDYQLATRYYYLLLLKSLSEKQLIDWKLEKTNKDYIKELAPKTEVNKEFKKLTYIYDYVWYGGFTIDKEKFFVTEDNFKKLIAKI